MNILLIWQEKKNTSVKATWVTSAILCYLGVKVTHSVLRESLNEIRPRRSVQCALASKTKEKVKKAHRKKEGSKESQGWQKKYNGVRNIKEITWQLLNKLVGIDFG